MKKKSFLVSSSCVLALALASCNSGDSYDGASTRFKDIVLS